jgi:type VI secretion system secreted protein VgrG
MAAGYRFALTGHDRLESNQDYVISHVRHEAKASDEGSATGAETYTIEFLAIPHSVPFRPLRQTPQPVVRGPETGVVVGPKGEDIFVDEHGRVKVQFTGTVRENRMKTAPAGFSRPALGGDKRGTLFIPRVGDEVLVAFLHGDLNRPVVIGSLYNGADKPPISLPGGEPSRRLNPAARKAAADQTSCDLKMRKIQKKSICMDKRIGDPPLRTIIMKPLAITKPLR